MLCDATRSPQYWMTLCCDNILHTQFKQWCDSVYQCTICLSSGFSLNIKLSSYYCRITSRCLAQSMQFKRAFTRRRRSCTMRARYRFCWLTTPLPPSTYRSTTPGETENFILPFLPCKYVD